MRMRYRATGLCLVVGLCSVLLLRGSGAAGTFFADVTEEVFGDPVLVARSTAFGDYDNDGWPDLFLAELDGPGIALFHNEGDGRFLDRTSVIQADVSEQWKGGGATFGDYDNDGDSDLYVPVGMYRSGRRDRNMLLRNDRGVFRNVTLEVGLTDSLPSDNAIWLDYDRDGYLDLYVGNLAIEREDSTLRNTLYRNRGDGTFTDATDAAGLDLVIRPDAGGSNNGMAAADFNDDGWPDLYLGVLNAPNRLFLSDGQGRFRDVTTREIGDPGEAYGVAVGDINNDGWLDIFQAAGGHRPYKGAAYSYRSIMLLSRGEGQFIGVTEGVGLSDFTVENVLSPGLADIDNDGDLDLLVAKPPSLFLNNGDGTFVDRTSASGLGNVSMTVSFGDYDLDGFVDVLFGWDSAYRTAALYRNLGNDNHYLRVELVGRESNRDGIGARLIATSGGLRQTREIFGGLGIYQDERVAHFGLGERTVVDRLEIRWPSGRADLLEDIPADQKIRVFEGRGGYHVITPSV